MLEAPSVCGFWKCLYLEMWRWGLIINDLSRYPLPVSREWGEGKDLLSLFYTWRPWSRESLSKLPRITQLRSKWWGRISNQALWCLDLCSKAMYWTAPVGTLGFKCLENALPHISLLKFLLLKMVYVKHLLACFRATVFKVWRSHLQRPYHLRAF